MRFVTLLVQQLRMIHISEICVSSNDAKNLISCKEKESRFGIADIHQTRAWKLVSRFKMATYLRSRSKKKKVNYFDDNEMLEEDSTTRIGANTFFVTALLPHSIPYIPYRVTLVCLCTSRLQVLNR